MVTEVPLSTGSGPEYDADDEGSAAELCSTAEDDAATELCSAAEDTAAVELCSRADAAIDAELGSAGAEAEGA